MFPDPLQAEVSTSLTWSRNNGNRGDHIPGDASGAELRYVRSGLLCHETSTDTVSWLQFGVQSRDMTREAAYCDEQLMRELFALRSSWMSSVLGWRGIVATHQELVDLILKPCTSRPANSEHYVVCQDRLNKCPDMGEYLLSVNMVMWENSRQIDGLKALIDALSPATRLNRLTTTLSRKKLWRFWKLAHKSAVAPTADAKTKQAPENAAHFVNVKTLELFLSSGNIVNGSRFIQPSSSGRSAEMMDNTVRIHNAGQKQDAGRAELCPDRKPRRRGHRPEPGRHLSDRAEEDAQKGHHHEDESPAEIHRANQQAILKHTSFLVEKHRAQIRTVKDGQLTAKKINKFWERMLEDHLIKVIQWSIIVQSIPVASDVHQLTTSHVELIWSLKHISPKRVLFNSGSAEQHDEPDDNSHHALPNINSSRWSTKSYVDRITRDQAYEPREPRPAVPGSFNLFQFLADPGQPIGALHSNRTGLDPGGIGAGTHYGTFKGENARFFRPIEVDLVLAEHDQAEARMKTARRLFRQEI
ncbi:conserved hypothetical protein [Culex quinquefasciatus]|uniref:Uncharacterized protein n=1 Tax=Culex quinquefasciatus TaxID=7176 RepID=B0XIX6_CULQU|nr:conserved hypothetical protein [Culex quinquefasciatus]|eukprot:XP_001869598.1 conserved hypothetical protein [Culex quinquefasciatus]